MAISFPILSYRVSFWLQSRFIENASDVCRGVMLWTFIGSTGREGLPVRLKKRLRIRTQELKLINSPIYLVQVNLDTYAVSILDRSLDGIVVVTAKRVLAA